MAHDDRKTSALASAPDRAWLAPALCLSASVLLAAACLVAQGPLPGDVALTRALQAALGEAPAWAATLTGSAKAPGVVLTLGLAVALAWARGGLRAAALPPLALLAAHVANVLLRAFVFAPKPSTEWVAVASASSASGLPSTFALVYGGLFGAVVLSRPTRGAVSTAAALAGAALVVVGCSARLVLGGHWASQILASLLLASAFVLALRLGLETALRGSEPGGRKITKSR